VSNVKVMMESLTFTTIKDSAKKTLNSLMRSSIVQSGLDGTCAETRFRLSVKPTSPCDLVGATVQSTTGS
jgi:hypothetical protein